MHHDKNSTYSSPLNYRIFFWLYVNHLKKSQHLHEIMSLSLSAWYLMLLWFLLQLLGCAMLGVGIWLLVSDDFTKYSDADDSLSFIYTGAYILVAIGGLIMIIGFLGCCGAIRESQCMLGCVSFPSGKLNIRWLYRQLLKSNTLYKKLKDVLLPLAQLITCNYNHSYRM